MFLISWIVSITLLISGLLWSPYLHAQGGGDKQYVMITFDGARNLSMWDATHEIAEKYDARLTYFVSGVYFLNDEAKFLYRPPGKSAGQSAIGFGRSEDEVSRRVAAVYRAMGAGHEISSHANGHYRGGLVTWRGVTEGLDWDFDQWSQEFEDFNGFLWDVYDNQNIRNGISERKWKKRLENQVHGFRAPNLSINPAMNRALGEIYSDGNFFQKFSYDSSGAKTITKPSRKAQGYWDLPLGHISIDGSDRRTIAMDYNFYVFDSKAKHDSENTQLYRERYYKSLRNYFLEQYSGRRGPVIIGNHFATWNNGAYYMGLVDFMREVCRKADVECITMAEYAEITENRSRTSLSLGFAPSGVPEWAIGDWHEALGDRSVATACTPESHGDEVDEDLLKELMNQY